LTFNINTNVSKQRIERIQKEYKATEKSQARKKTVYVFIESSSLFTPAILPFMFKDSILKSITY